MHELAPLITDLAIMLGIASIVTVLFQKIHQPVILGYIIAGIIIGPYTPPYSLVTDVTQITTLSEIGVIFLMFALGLDFNFHKIRKNGISILITGLAKVLLTGSLGFAIGKIIKWPLYDCIFLGAALAISSTTIIIKALDELNLKGKRFTDIVFGILIVEDLLAILILTTLSTIGITKYVVSLDTIKAIIKLIIVVGSWFLSGYFIVPILFRKTIKYINQETLTIVSIALCLTLAVIAAKLHYSAALGAFIMGSILAETPLDIRIKKLTAPLRDIFAAVFFISIGMLIDFRAILAQWPLILIISILAITGKVLITNIFTFLTGQNISTSIRVGFSMTPIGEFSFIIVSTGLALNVTSNSLYQTVIGVAAISIVLTPYLMKLSNNIVKKLETGIISGRTKYFLEKYSAWVYRTSASYKKQIEYRKFAFRLILNGVVVGVIFTLVYNFVLPKLSFFVPNPDIAKILSWIIALTMASPFVWGMFFSFKLIHKHLQLIPLFLSFVITTLQIIILSIAYFNTWYIPIVVAVIISIFFGFSSKQLGTFYYWFERYLLYLLKSKRKRNKYEELSPWDTHLIEVIANNETQDSIIGKTLSNSQLRKKFGITIIAICRGSKAIFAPRGSEKILLYDKLMVIGNDEQTDNFKKTIEDPLFEPKDENILKDYMLKSIILEPNNPLVGETIRNSNIREQICGLVVGLERNGFRTLNPDSSTVLKTNDLLLIVGKEDKINNLQKTLHLNKHPSS